MFLCPTFAIAAKKKLKAYLADSVEGIGIDSGLPVEWEERVEEFHSIIYEMAQKDRAEAESFILNPDEKLAEFLVDAVDEPDYLQIAEKHGINNVDTNPLANWWIYANELYELIQLIANYAGDDYLVRLNSRSTEHQISGKQEFREFLADSVYAENFEKLERKYNFSLDTRWYDPQGSLVASPWRNYARDLFIIVWYMAKYSKEYQIDYRQNLRDFITLSVDENDFEKLVEYISQISYVEKAT